MKRAVAAILVLAALAAAIALILPRAPKPGPVFTGSFISKSEKGLNWITFDRVAGDVIRCQWNKLQLKPDGKYTEQNMRLTGTEKEGKLSMNADTQLPGGYKITAVAEHRGAKIAMSMYLQDRETFTAEFTPVTSLELVVAEAEFKKQVTQRQEDQRKAVEASITEEERERRRVQDERRAMIDEGNFYVEQIKEFLGQYQNTQKEYAHNTKKMKDYLENVKKVPGKNNVHIRKQLLVSMRDILVLTEKWQNMQTHFIRNYNHKMVPFLNRMAEKRLNCLKRHTANGVVDKASGEGLICNTAFGMETTLLGYTKDIRKAIDEVSATYKKEMEAQLAIIKKAEAVQ